jgi:formylglycine-generating enzyme required for sulfatase activity
MDTARLLHLLAAGDLTAWPNLARDIERRADAQNAAQALALLHAQGHVEEAAQWLARVTDAPELQTLRAQVLAQSQGWQVGRLRALTKDLLSADFRLIPAGSFVMGSPEDEEGHDINETQQLVEITQPFLLKSTLITQAEWQMRMGNNPARFQGDDRRPVERVTWDDVTRFCDALSAETGGTYTLPTEAQWEYACRAGTTAARYGDIDDIAWYSKNSNRSTQPVGQKQPNTWGLYDMLGNVWEWCQDLYVNDASALQYNPHGPPSGDYRMYRGGSWARHPMLCRAAFRDPVRPTYRGGFGFRPAGLLC